MKNFKLLLALLITIFFLNCKVSAQTNSTTTDSDLLTVRIFESSALASRSYIVIAYGNGKIEEVPLNEVSVTSKGAKANVDVIATILGKIMKDGYVLISSTAGSPGGILITTYIFNKN